MNLEDLRHRQTVRGCCPLPGRTDSRPAGHGYGTFLPGYVGGLDGPLLASGHWQLWSKVLAVFEGVEDFFRQNAPFSVFFRVFLRIRNASGERGCRNNLARPFHLSPRKMSPEKGRDFWQKESHQPRDPGDWPGFPGTQV